MTPFERANEAFDAALGLTSKIVRVEIDGRGYWKEQWYYNGEPTDYKRQEGPKNWAERNGITLNYSAAADAYHREIGKVRSTSNSSQE